MDEGSTPRHDCKSKESEFQGQGKRRILASSSTAAETSTPGEIINSAMTLSRSLLKRPGSFRKGLGYPAFDDKDTVGESSRGHETSDKLQCAEKSTSIRAGASQGHPGTEFEAFLDSHMSGAINEAYGGLSACGHHSAPQTAGEQQLLDGLEVIAILQKPDVAMEDDLDELGLDTSSAAAKRLGEALFPDVKGRDARWNHILNFWPVCAAGLHQTNAISKGGFSIDDCIARDRWLADWRDVLERYTDEIWGDIEPVVQEARTEIGSATKDGTMHNFESNFIALRRLRMILVHLRGS